MIIYKYNQPLPPSGTLQRWWGTAPFQQTTEPVKIQRHSEVLTDIPQSMQPEAFLPVHIWSKQTSYLERSFEGVLLRAISVLVAATFIWHIQLTWETPAQSAQYFLSMCNLLSLLALRFCLQGRAYSSFKTTKMLWAFKIHLKYFHTSVLTRTRRRRHISPTLAPSYTRTEFKLLPLIYSLAKSGPTISQTSKYQIILVENIVLRLRVSKRGIRDRAFCNQLQHRRFSW